MTSFRCRHLPGPTSHALRCTLILPLPLLMFAVDKRCCQHKNRKKWLNVQSYTA